MLEHCAVTMNIFESCKEHLIQQDCLQDADSLEESEDSPQEDSSEESDSHGERKMIEHCAVTMNIFESLKEHLIQQESLQDADSLEESEDSPQEDSSEESDSREEREESLLFPSVGLPSMESPQVEYSREESEESLQEEESFQEEPSLVSGESSVSGEEVDSRASHQRQYMSCWDYVRLQEELQRQRQQLLEGEDDAMSTCSSCGSS